MREIKFKYWCNQRKKMFIEPMDSYYTGDYFGDERFTPLQYTGLKDKNGKEIYEGDIIEQEFLGIAMIDYSEFIGVVKFIDGSYVVENIDGSYGRELFQEIDTNEVIGNIYENPELLK